MGEPYPVQDIEADVADIVHHRNPDGYLVPNQKESFEEIIGLWLMLEENIVQIKEDTHCPTTIAYPYAEKHDK